MKKQEPLKTKIYLESCALSKKLEDREFYKFFSGNVDKELGKNLNTADDFAHLVTASSTLDRYYILRGFKKIFEADKSGIVDVKTGCYLRAIEFSFSFRKERIEKETIDSSFVCGLDIIQALQFSGIALVFEDLVSFKQALFISKYYIENCFLHNYDKKLEAQYKVFVAAIDAKMDGQSVGDAVKKEFFNQSIDLSFMDYINLQFENIWKLAVKHFKQEGGDYFSIPEAALFPTHLIGIAKELVSEGALTLDGTHAWELLVNSAMQPNLEAFSIESRFIKAKELVIAKYGVLAE